MYNQMTDSSAFRGANRHVVRGQPCRRASVPLSRLKGKKEEGAGVGVGVEQAQP